MGTVDFSILVELSDIVVNGAALVYGGAVVLTGYILYRIVRS